MRPELTREEVRAITDAHTEFIIAPWRAAGFDPHPVPWQESPCSKCSNTACTENLGLSCCTSTARLLAMQYMSKETG